MRTLSATAQVSWASRLVLAIGLAAALTLGCERRLTIRQDDYINNAMHRNRPPARRTGEPLELTVVCVLPADLKDAANADLKPGSPINSRTWYARRPGAQLAPIPGLPAAPPFNIPASQIFTLDENNPEPSLRPLHGKVIEGGDRELLVTDKIITIKIPWGDLVFNDRNCVVYVFGRFADENGDILPVPPAVFERPGQYKSELFVKVGSNGKWDSPDRGQYIENITKPG